RCTDLMNRWIGESASIRQLDFRRIDLVIMERGLIDQCRRQEDVDALPKCGRDLDIRLTNAGWAEPSRTRSCERFLFVAVRRALHHSLTVKHDDQLGALRRVLSQDARLVPPYLDTHIGPV